MILGNVLLHAESGSGNRRERSPAPHFDRSDSVTPTNEVVDEESLTPRSVSSAISNYELHNINNSLYIL